MTKTSRYTYGVVKISTPDSITTTVCSNWAESFLSLVVTVHRSAKNSILYESMSNWTLAHVEVRAALRASLGSVVAYNCNQPNTRACATVPVCYHMPRSISLNSSPELPAGKRVIALRLVDVFGNVCEPLWRSSDERSLPTIPKLWEVPETYFKACP